MLYSYYECYSETVIIPEHTYDKITETYKNMIPTMNTYAHAVLAETNTDSLCRKVSSTQTFLSPTNKFNTIWTKKELENGRANQKLWVRVFQKGKNTFSIFEQTTEERNDDQ